MSRPVQYTASEFRFLYSRRKMNGRARRAVGYDRNGPASRLVRMHSEPSLVSIKVVKDLGLPQRFTASRYLYDFEVVQDIVGAIRERTDGPVFYRLEVGKEGRLHVHLIADGAREFLYLPRGGEVVKPVVYLLGLMAYLHKPPVPYSLEAEMEYREALERNAGKLPKLSNYLRLRQTN